MALDFNAIGSRTLNRDELGQLNQQYGIDVNARGYEGGAIGGSGQELYHTGTGWGVRPAGQTSPTQPAAAPAGPQAPQTAQQALTQPVQSGQPTNVTGAFQQALMSQLSAPTASVNSAELQPALAANRLSEQRGMERNRALLAERAAATGTNMSGGFETALQGLAQDRAAREGQFAGQAVSNLAQQQRQQIMQALGLAGGMLSDQDRMALQNQLAQLDAQLRREGLGVQSSLGQGDLALRDKLGTGNLNLGLLGLLSNNQQFDQNLGAQLGMFNANLNQNALLSLLGGGL